MAAGRHKNKSGGLIFEEQADAQANPDFEIARRELANSETAVPVRIAKTAFDLLQRWADFYAKGLGVFADGSAERRRQINRLQS